jgi:hypothetical protein
MSRLQTKYIEICTKDDNNKVLSTISICVSGISHMHNLCESIMDLDMGEDMPKEDMKKVITEKLSEILNKIIK